MVAMTNIVKRIRRERSGIVLVEAMLTLPIMIMIVVVMVEAGFAIFQWNMSVKALQIGARLAAVSSPILTTSEYDNLTADYTGLLEGDAVPSSVVSVSCGAGTTACDAAQFSRLIRGADGVCGNPPAGTPTGICDVA